MEQSQQEDILIAKRELFELEDYIRKLWQFMPIPIAFISPLGIILEVDDGVEKLTGYTREELVGESLLDICAEEKRMMQVQEWTLGGKPVKSHEGCSLIDARGQRIPVSISTLVRTDDESGEPTGYFAAFIDITKRKQAEELLTDSERRYRLLADNVTDVIWTIDTNMKFTYISPSATPLLGYSVDEAITLPLEELLTAASYDVAMKAFKEALAVENAVQMDAFKSPTLELELRHKDGSAVWLEVKSTFLPLQDGQPVGFVGVARDITERKQAEKKLRESEAHYRLLAENATDVIWTVDINSPSRLTYISPSVTRLIGYSVEEAMSRTMEEAFTPASYEAAMKALDEELAIENMKQKDLLRSRKLELEMNCKDGSTVPVEVNYTFLRQLDGKPSGVLAIARDITKRKQAEEKLQKTYTKERELRQKVEAEINKRIEFTRALVHELKTPLTPILASSDLLLEELKEEPWLGLARNINQAASNLNQRIDELLDMARGEIGMLRLNPESVDPVQLLKEIADVMMPIAIRNGQSLISELADSLPEIWADESRLRQVVLNLLNNAFKFTPPGGKITLRAKKDDANLIVEVQDTGRGISKKDRQRLFEPYYQLESKDERLSGLGLGLALSKTLVELHRGKIWAKGQKGKGSTFGFSVPLAAGQRNKGNKTG